MLFGSVKFAVLHNFVIQKPIDRQSHINLKPWPPLAEKIEIARKDTSLYRLLEYTPLRYKLEMIIKRGIPFYYVVVLLKWRHVAATG